MKRTFVFWCIFLFVVSIQNVFPDGKKKFGFKEAIQFPALRNPTISSDGRWVAYSLVPNWGDSKSVLINVEDNSKYEFERCTEPKFSFNSRWLVFKHNPKFTDIENAEDEKPQSGVMLVNLLNQKREVFEKASSYVFSNNSKWLVIKYFPEKAKSSKKSKEEKVLPEATKITLVDLENDSKIDISNVIDFSFDSLSQYLAYSVFEKGSKNNGLYLLNLAGYFSLPKRLDGDSNTICFSLSWNNKTQNLAYVKTILRKSTIVDSSLIYEYSVRTNEFSKLVDANEVPVGWYIPYKNNLKWTEDGERLFFGIKPLMDTVVQRETEKLHDTDVFNIEKILKRANYTLWHWLDSKIKPHERKWWDKNKDRLFYCIYHLKKGKFFQLSNLEISQIEIVDNPYYTIGYSHQPYEREATWQGDYFDLYLINLQTGEQRLIEKKLSEKAYLSPLGKYLVFYKDKNWFLFDPQKDTLANLTGKMKYAFYDEDYDQPSPAPNYGFGGWFENDIAFLIYDKYDIWKFFCDSYSYICQTVIYGRDLQQTYRVIKLKEDKKHFSNFDSVLISVFDHKTKQNTLYALQFNILGPDRIIDDDKLSYKFIQKADSADRVLLRVECYEQYPELYIANLSFKFRKQITNHQQEFVLPYEWGTTELVRWVNSKGDTLDGFIIKPANFDSTKKYPLIVWYYERFSQMKNDFIFPFVGHRPCFQIYNSDGYVFFLPDIKYTIGHPGNSALDCITTGVRSLLKRKFIDSTAIGLMGHSWSGYQTAYIITQTPMFAAAVAGAPVGNMTSAYSGIRLESGLARQFQYEGYQSRIGGNLWDSLANYISNSPIFSAPKASTPILIMFGDEDGAVPWQQGIELYLAFRRANKPVFFLQYHNEGHWPNKYFNRLHYALKIKEFFDTYLKKTPPPDWIRDGESIIIKE